MCAVKRVWEDGSRWRSLPFRVIQGVKGTIALTLPSLLSYPGINRDNLRKIIYSSMES